MVERIGQNFRTGSEVLANYNFIDIVQGRSYLTLYGFINLQNSHALTAEVVYSSKPDDAAESTASGTDGLYSTEGENVANDYDFDIENTGDSFVIQGDVLYQIPILFVYNSTGSHAVHNALTVNLSYVRDGTETVLATSTDEARAYFSASGGGVYVGVFNIADKTKIKKGDTVRLTVQTEAQSNHAVRIYHDPQDRAASPLPTSVLKVNIPIVTDI